MQFSISIFDLHVATVVAGRKDPGIFESLKYISEQFHPPVAPDEQNDRKDGDH